MYFFSPDYQLCDKISKKMSTLIESKNRLEINNNEKGEERD